MVFPADALPQLAHYLAGEFDNRQQSLTDPIWYLHLRLWLRPLPRSLFDQGYGLLIEQISVAAATPPYRQRVLHLGLKDGGLWGQYYGLQDPLAWRGEASQPQRLAALTPQDLVPLPTCALAIQADLDTGWYRAHPSANTLCSFTYQGQTSYVRLGFEVGPNDSGGVLLRLCDRGVNPDTGQLTWGPAMGPFALLKQASYSVDQPT